MELQNKFDKGCFHEVEYILILIPLNEWHVFDISRIAFPYGVYHFRFSDHGLFDYSKAYPFPTPHALFAPCPILIVSVQLISSSSLYFCNCTRFRSAYRYIRGRNTSVERYAAALAICTMRLPTACSLQNFFPLIVKTTGVLYCSK